MKPQEKIQTLHPDPAKSGKNIDLAKYELIREAILSILGTSEPTHQELMEAIHSRVSTKMQGNAQWYGETVKLDLEARKLIERVGKNPVRYRLVLG